MLTNRDQYYGKVIRVDEVKVQILYEDGNDQGPHVHFWQASDEDPPLEWLPAPPRDALDSSDYADWNDDIHPDLWEYEGLPRKGERVHKHYSIVDDVRIDHFISMSELDLFFQKVVTASNAYAAKVLSTPFTSIVLFCCLLQYVESQDGMSSVVYTLPVMYKLLRLILLYALRGGVPGGIPFRSMWSTSSYIGVDSARKIMARDEALTYLRYLHLPAEGEGKNNKVNIMITTLRDNCLRNVRPGPVRPLLLVICLPLTFST